jgi:hypothetical protein
MASSVTPVSIVKVICGSGMLLLTTIEQEIYVSLALLPQLIFFVARAMIVYCFTALSY